MAQDQPSQASAEATATATRVPPNALDALPWAVFWLSAEGELRGANQPFLDLLGVRDEAALASSPSGLFAEPALLEAWIEEARRRGECATRASLNAPGGRHVDVGLTLRMLPGDEGLLGVVTPLDGGQRRPAGAARDKDVDHAMHRTEEWSRAVEAAADHVGLGVAISVLGEGGEPRLAFVNAAGAHILGRTREELVHGPMFPQLSPDLEARLRRASSEALMGRLAVDVARPDGTSVPLQLGFSLGNYWGRPAVFAFFRDVTREHELEQAERWAREQLVRSLEETARLKTELLNVAAHELSNPLTPIVLQVQLLKSRLASTAGEKDRAALDMLDRNVRRLGRLLDDLLEVSRMQAGRLALRRERVDVAQLVQDVLQTYADTAKRLGVELVREVSGPAEIDADPDRVAQVVGNFVGNALKFTPRGGRVTVAVLAGPDEVAVRVTDTGVGLREQELPRLFQPFAQMHGKEKGGTGLGLFISKGVVEQHGGRIWAESEGPGRGATFSFTLPLSRARTG
ncbi:MAG TPA: ATP-binding protein [Candidatus Thermoplasmatota archaeon]|nr:ATP-binding protein [Candidatus Thermoplasmatota archaeon]